jgi:signal transduction histidine kinase
MILDVFGGDKSPYGKAMRMLKGVSLLDTSALFPTFTTENAALMLSAIRTASQTKTPQIVEISNAGALVYECHIAPIQERAEVLVTSRDITTRRHQERALAISERMVFLGTLAAGLGHEINNPLTYMLANQQSLLEYIDKLSSGKDVDLPTMKALTQEVLQGTERVRDIVKDLRSFSRVEPQLQKPVQLASAIEEALRMLHPQLRHQAKISTSLTPMWVRGEHSRIVQVFVNLVINALQALPEELAKNNLVSVVTLSENDRAIAIVEDNGYGIPQQDLPRIFDPFFTTKPAGQGTGLGLAIVHRIMEEFGGSITVESEPNRGTRMRLSFEQVSPPEQTEPTTPTTVSVERKQRVMVIDDDILVAKTVARSLRSFDVTICNSGQDALNVFSQNGPFDVIVCDLNMPECDGIEVYEAIVQQNSSLKDLFLFMTGGVFTERIQAFLDTIRPPVFEKPGHPKEILRKVEALLHISSPQKEPTQK